MNVLLRQAGSFESLILFDHRFHPNEPVSSERKEHKEGNVPLDSASPALGVLHDLGENGVPYRLKPLCLEGRSLKLLKEVAPIRPYLIKP
jgi:hypothetical protein